MKVYTADELHAVLESHLAWLKDEINGACANLSGANLSGANLRDAYLSGADLRGAHLIGADLSNAHLRDADLRGANLRGAHLSDADLRGANLRNAYLGGANLRDAYLRDAYLGGADLGGADLSGANLRDANLRDANLRRVKAADSAIMPGGYTFAVYKSDVVPALLTAGGKSLADVVSNAWDCHEWTNCPMAYAFGVHEISEIPPLYRESAEFFINLFDANLIPRPTVSPNPTQAEQV